MQSSVVSCQSEHGYVRECLSLNSFLDMFPDKRRKIAHLVCYVYLSYDTGIHDGINCQLIGVGNWTLEHNNTGKSPQKCYSCIDEGMDKLTEYKAKFARQGYLHKCHFLITAVCYKNFTTCWNSIRLKF